jgi:L-ectoine synthase
VIVRAVSDLTGTKGDVRTDHWSSLRFLHREDGMGFTFTDTTLKAGMDQVIAGEVGRRSDPGRHL